MDMSTIMDKDNSFIRNMYKEDTFHIFCNQQKEAIGSKEEWNSMAFLIIEW